MRRWLADKKSDKSPCPSPRFSFWSASRLLLLAIPLATDRRFGGLEARHGTRALSGGCTLLAFIPGAAPNLIPQPKLVSAGLKGGFRRCRNRQSRSGKIATPRLSGRDDFPTQGLFQFGTAAEVAANSWVAGGEANARRTAAPGRQARRLCSEERSPIGFRFALVTHRYALEASTIMAWPGSQVRHLSEQSLSPVNYAM